MPKKPNKAGQPQEYVPAGNGDASGEYADEAGSNRNFTVFKKPDEEKETDNIQVDEETTETVKDNVDKEHIEEKQKGLKERLNLNEQNESKMKNTYALFLQWGDDEETIKEKLTKRLLSGDFGFIERTPEEMNKEYEDYYDDVLKWMAENKPEVKYYKKGGKWVSTYLDESWRNTKFYTQQEYDELVKKETEKNLKQTSTDIEINNLLGKDCIVSFGKKYSDNYLKETVEATKKVVGDFPEMKGFIKAIGDRNSIEKLSMARVQASLTPENIAKEAEKYIQEQSLYGKVVSMEKATDYVKNKMLKSAISLQRGGSNVLAYWSPSQRALVMLPKTSKQNADENQKHYFERNWHSSDKPMGTYFHEMGHAISSMLANYKRSRKSSILVESVSRDFSFKMDELYAKNITENYNEEYVKRYNKIRGTNFSNMSEVRNDFGGTFSERYQANSEVKEELKKDNIKKYVVSEYGNTNKEEFLAECFSAYYTGMNNELANKVVETVKNYYNDLRSI